MRARATTWFRGGAGNDTISGGRGQTTFLSGGGRQMDVLVGGDGRDLLIGGPRGRSPEQANAGDDLLIGGTTLYYGKPSPRCTWSWRSGRAPPATPTRVAPPGAARWAAARTPAAGIFLRGDDVAGRGGESDRFRRQHPWTRLDRKSEYGLVPGQHRRRQQRRQGRDHRPLRMASRQPISTSIGSLGENTGIPSTGESC